VRFFFSGLNGRRGLGRKIGSKKIWMAGNKSAGEGVYAAVAPIFHTGTHGQLRVAQKARCIPEYREEKLANEVWKIDPKLAAC